MDNTSYKNISDSKTVKENTDEDITLINSNPEAHRVLNNSLDDYAHGRFVDFKF